MASSTAITAATISINVSSISSINETTAIPGILSIGSQSYPLSIKGHGNWTWTCPKKPFKIELNTKASLLNMPANKDWILLANWSDKGFTNTTAAMAVGSSLLQSHMWTPKSRWIDLSFKFQDGSIQYWGIYQLIESVKISGVRIDEESVDGDTGLGLTGTYLMEINQQNHPDEQSSTIQTNKGLRIIMDDPDGSASAAQKNYITSWINNFEEALFATDAFTRTGNISYRSMIDMNSFATWYVIEELASNQDSYFYGSCKIYKTQDTTAKPGVLFMGPIWDFDISFGNVVNSSHDARELCTLATEFGSSATWLLRMFDDEVFMQAVNNVWNRITNSWGKDGAALVSLNASTQQDLLGNPQPNAFQRNMALWKDNGYRYAAVNDWAFSTDSTYYNLYPTKKDWINARFHFMERLYGNIALTSVTFTSSGSFHTQSVLQEMQAALMSRRAVWQVNAATMGFQPAAGDICTITYTQDGAVKQRSAPTNGSFDFSKTILSVSYGANQSYDMSDKYNNDPALFNQLYLVMDGHATTDFIVNNTNMGGDPDYGVVKSCTIRYQQFPNQVKSVTIPENGKVVFEW